MAIREIPCCMCPATDDIREVCENCEFYNDFEDKRGVSYSVRARTEETKFYTLKADKYIFNTFCKKPKQKDYVYGFLGLLWRETREEAQQDLNALAIKKKWRVVKEVPRLV